MTDSAARSHAVSCVYATVSVVLISLNYAFLCHFPEKKWLRLWYLAISGPLGLALVPHGINAFAKALSVQISGAYFVAYLRAFEYSVLEDPCPKPRSNWQYFLSALRDTYLPFEGAAVASRDPREPSPQQVSEAQQLQRNRQIPSARRQLERQPLAAANTSYAAAVARLLLELAMQYLLYDFLLTACVKPMSDATLSVGRSYDPPALFSFGSIQASAAFTVCLYLHFAISYKGVLLVLSLRQPSLLYRCKHLFREPWLGLTSVSELWQRWHQMFRMVFVRLAYRPARTLVRRLRGGRGRAAAATGRDGPGMDGEAAHSKADGKPATGNRNGGGAAAAAIEEAVALMAVFTLSGIIHEYMCWASFGVSRGWQLGFFLAHGAAILVEQAAAAGIRSSTVSSGGWVPPGVLRGALRAACLTFCVVSSAVFMRPWLEAGYHRDIWHPVSPVAWALKGVAAARG